MSEALSIVIDRRSVVAALAAMLGLSVAQPVSALAAIPSRIIPTTRELQAARARLLPALFDCADGEFYVDIFEQCDGLIVIGWDARFLDWRDDPSSLGFFLSPGTIVDGSYVIGFASSLTALRGTMRARLHA